MKRCVFRDISPPRSWRHQTPQSAGFPKGLRREVGGGGRDCVSASASGPALSPCLLLGADHLVSSYEMVLFCLKVESKIRMPSFLSLSGILI